MHEVGIMQSTLEIALEWANRQGAQRIHRLGMRVGALSGVVPDALDFAFEVLRQGTPAEGACLEVEFIPLRIYCPACDREFSPDGYWYTCPECNGVDTQVRQGRELEIAFVEVSGEGEADESHAGTLDS